MTIDLDINPVAFELFGFPVRYYGICWAIGLVLTERLYFNVFCTLYNQSNRHLKINRDFLLERDIIRDYIFNLLFMMLIGVVFFARLGNILFYSYSNFRYGGLWQIFNIKHGISGLSSHGGLFGGCLGMVVFYVLYRSKITLNQKPVRFTQLQDVLALSCFPLLSFIRIGNFLNQEIVGTECSYTIPWGVVFMRTSDYSPRHPVVLYESLAYLCIGTIMYFYYHNRVIQSNGRLFYIAVILFFSARFLIEFFKEGDVLFAGLIMPQVLSISFILVAIIGGLINEYIHSKENV